MSDLQQAVWILHPRLELKAMQPSSGIYTTSPEQRSIICNRLFFPAENFLLPLALSFAVIPRLGFNGSHPEPSLAPLATGRGCKRSTAIVQGRRSKERERKRKKTHCAPGVLACSVRPSPPALLLCATWARPPPLAQAPLTLPSSPALIRLHSYLTAGCSGLPLQLCSRPGI